MNLLEVWQCIYEEAGQLADTVDRLPDACECGDSNTHLEERCRCCERHEQAADHHNGGVNCNTILARLRADLTMLSKDFFTVAGPLDGAALVRQRVELRRSVFLAADDLQQVLDAFERVSGAVAGFRHTCAVADMRRVKRHCAELREHCERVNGELLEWKKAVASEQKEPPEEPISP
jgi:hypothetical protein